MRSRICCTVGYRKIASGGSQRLVTIAISIDPSGGCAAVRIVSAKPRRRKISMVRALQRSILGQGPGARSRSTRPERTPRRDSSSARARPTGPAPTMHTSKSTIVPSRRRIYATREEPLVHFAKAPGLVIRFARQLLCRELSPPAPIHYFYVSTKRRRHMVEERDLIVTMRDGTRLAVDVYRPDQPGKYPVLYACALHNKDIQGPDIADILPPQPAHAPLWFGPIEAGDTRRFIANGYVHVVAQPRGSAKSEGHYGHEDTDHYDLIEWITKQPWSNGKVGMVGISGYAGEQWRAAAQGHPALKAIFPYDACSAYGGMFGFRDFNPGGVIHTFPYLLDVFSTVHESRDRPAELPPAEEALWRRAMQNPDFKQYINLYNILTQKGQRTFIMYLMLTQPWEAEGVLERAEATFKKIKIPFYTGSGAYAYTYKLHWLGAQHYFQNVDAPKRRPFTR